MLIYNQSGQTGLVLLKYIHFFKKNVMKDICMFSKCIVFRYYVKTDTKADIMTSKGKLFFFLLFLSGTFITTQGRLVAV